MNRALFNALLREMCAKAAEVLEKRGMEIFDKLTEDEVKSMLGEGPAPGFGYRLPKIVMQVAAERIEPEFGAESTVKDVKRVRRILGRRM